MSKKSLDEALELMNLVSEQFGGFRIDLTNGDSMKIADVLHQVADLLSEYDDWVKRLDRELVDAEKLAKGLYDRLENSVEVVRCADCKRWDDVRRAIPNRGWCKLLGEATWGHFYCQQGERKEEHAEES